MARIAKPFFETTCHKCGFIDEAKFTFSTNGAVKQVCNNCGFYQKFFDKASVPSIQDIKMKTWYMVEGNLEAIKIAKQEVEFVEHLNGLTSKLMYWKLYLHVRNTVNKIISMGENV